MVVLPTGKNHAESATPFIKAFDPPMPANVTYTVFLDPLEGSRKLSRESLVIDGVMLLVTRVPICSFMMSDAESLTSYMVAFSRLYETLPPQYSPNDLPKPKPSPVALLL